MKELKNKEVVIGLITLIILCILAIFLILKREFPQEQKNAVLVEEMNAENVVSRDDGLFIEEMVENTMEVDPVEMAELQENQKQAASAETAQNLGLNEYADRLSEFYTAPQYAEYTGEDMWGGIKFRQTVRIFL